MLRTAYGREINGNGLMPCVDFAKTKNVSYGAVRWWIVNGVTCQDGSRVHLDYVQGTSGRMVSDELYSIFVEEMTASACG